MNISAISNNYNSTKMAFGVALGGTVSNIVSNARFDAFKTKNPQRILTTLQRIEDLKKMKNNFVLTAFLKTCGHESGTHEVYSFFMKPRNYCLTHSELIKEIPANTPPMIILAKIFKAVKNYPEKIMKNI